MARVSKLPSRKKVWFLTAILFILVFLSFVLSNISSINQIVRSKAATQSLSLAVMGDSVSDEYRADDNRGGAYSATTFNWLEQLVKYRGVNVGAWRNWGGHRRTGYEFNYSRSGATTTSGMGANAHVSVGQLASTGAVQVVYYELGPNDFAWYYPIFGQIYSGELSGTSLDTYISGVISNIRNSLNEINKSQRAKIIVSLVPDTTLAPPARAQFPDTAKLKRVSDAVAKVNSFIRTESSAKGYAVFDTDVIGQKLLARIDAQGYMTVGGEKISFVTAGDEPHHIQLGDKIHAGTVYSGIYANEWMDAVNKSFGYQFQLFSDDEILIFAGIKKATSTPVSTISPTASATATPTVSPSVIPSTTPSSTPRVTASPTATPRPTATPKPVDPYLQYCGTYRTYRSMILKYLSPAQIVEWDKRCGL